MYYYKMTYFYLVIPLILGYLTSYFFPIDKKSGEKVNAKPPSWVFVILWPILYLLIGYTWYKLRNDFKDKKYTEDFLFIIFNICLCLWIILYRLNKKYGLYILLVCYGISLFIVLYNIQNKVSLFLVPVSVWLLFATLLNFQEVNTITNTIITK